MGASGVLGVRNGALWVETRAGGLEMGCSGSKHVSGASKRGVVEIHGRGDKTRSWGVETHGWGRSAWLEVETHRWGVKTHGWKWKHLAEVETHGWGLKRMAGGLNT